MSENRIKGKIPEWLWSLPRLRSVNLGNNPFNGFQGSSEMLVKSSVQTLSLDENNFEGVLPDPPFSIKYFSMSYNRFIGETPLSICNRRSFDVLILSYNSIPGKFPQCLTNLTFVNLRKNNMEGSIPDNFHVGASLRTLDVGYNQITGNLPRSPVNCSYLTFVTVDNNKIEDTFPFWLKALTDLQVLIIRSNKFYGPISLPHQRPLGFPELRIFEIPDNKFTGSLPPRYAHQSMARLIEQKSTKVAPAMVFFLLCFSKIAIQHTD